jgi:hypothetical protein
MSASPGVESTQRVTAEEWRTVLAAARGLAEKVAELSRRLAAVEQRLSSDDRQASARPRPFDR